MLREALRRTKKVGLGQLALRGREYIVSLKPCGRGMVLETLRYADEVNKAQGYFRDIPDGTPDADLLDLAETLIDKKTAKFDPQEYHDRYVEALRDLVERKRKAKGGKIIEETDEPTGRSASNVVDLMAALKKSLEKRRGAKPSAEAKTTTATKKTAAKKAPASATAAAKKPAAKKRA